MKFVVNTLEPVVRIYSEHPLAAQTIKSAIEADGSFGKTRVLNTRQQLLDEEQGHLLLLDGCCNDRWPEIVLRWQKGGGKILILFSFEASHWYRQRQALLLGASGVVKVSGNWQVELRQAIKAILEGTLWINREVLNEYVRRTNGQYRNCPQDVDPLPYLTTREEQIMALLLRGDSNKKIAGALGISERTVKYHVSNILQKWQVRGRKELLQAMSMNDDLINTENLFETLEPLVS